MDEKDPSKKTPSPHALPPRGVGVPNVPPHALFHPQQYMQMMQYQSVHGASPSMAPMVPMPPLPGMQQVVAQQASTPVAKNKSASTPVAKNKSAKKKKAVAKQPKPNGKAKNLGGSGSRFSREEKTILLDLIEDVMPFSNSEWQKVGLAYNEKVDEEREREWLNLRKLFRTLWNHSVPTGDPKCPPDVKRAKRLYWSIKAKSGMETGSDIEISSSDDEMDDDDDDETIRRSDELVCSSVVSLRLAVS